MQDETAIHRARIYRGRQHKLVFLALQEQPLLVSEIMRAVNNNLDKGTPLSIRETSRALKWLATHGYARCLNPSSEHGVKGILYQITKVGNKVKDALPP